ncbi:type VI secretion system-associated protein VasI [Pseudomonas entomophila]|uniref:type VI secretion system-associated protein VasI n=1 Tax=Pseudomonas entomophila TaxID=312306 RepID=UPI003EB7F7DD
MVARHPCGICFASLLYCLPVSGSSHQECSRIVSNLERLACFDRSAGTPARLGSAQWSASEQDAPTLRRVLIQEADRAPDDLTFRLGEAGEGLMVSAPAIASGPPHAYLAISCVQNISRLQLVTARPIEAGRVSVRLQGESRATSATPWQVMENGQVIDAGRGLPGIEQIKQLIGARRIHVESDHPAVNGLTFDAHGLDALIDKVRTACRW